MVGAGANRKLTSRMLRALVDRVGIPFFSTQMGKCVIDETHPLWLGTAALSNGTKIMPSALLDHTTKWNAISSATPGEDQYVGVGGGDGFSRGVCAGSADKVSTRGFNKLCNPGL